MRKPESTSTEFAHVISYVKRVSEVNGFFGTRSINSWNEDFHDVLLPEEIEIKPVPKGPTLRALLSFS